MTNPYRPQPPAPYYPPQQYIVPAPPPYYYPAPYQPPAPRYVDGMSTGAHIRHTLLSIVTCGLWIPVYVLTYYLSRHRIS